MSKAIVTTTINKPTQALKRFIEIGERDDWIVVIVGDKKTPHKPYLDLEGKHEHVYYLHPDTQEKKYPLLSELIGWNCIQRRNFGLLFAYEAGADIIATVDDDNIPYPRWGQNCLVDRSVDMVMYKSHQIAFDPLSPTVPNLWHRGFPVQLLDKRSISKGGLIKRTPLVQADMWDGDPDIDAICRIALAPDVRFNPNLLPFGSDKPGPFNSQNTFLSRKVFPDYFLFPHVGRMDDIWASFALQFKYPDCVIYNKATVKQERNPHDYIKDLDAELLGYRHNLAILEDPKNWQQFLPAPAIKAYAEWHRLIGEIDGGKISIGGKDGKRS